MLNVQNVDRFFFDKDDKQETVGTAIARAEEQFADWSIK
jgi:hypothetical protein